MKSLKHIGRLNNTGSKVLVVFRTLPGESDHALVLPVGNLSPQDHDTIMSMVETPQAQDSYELGEIMFIRTFSDGRRMLQAANADGILIRVKTDQVIMTPNTRDEVPLSQLNVLIAEQKNCAVDDLYTFVKGAVKVEEAVKVKDLGEPSVPEYADLEPNNEAAKTTSQSVDGTLAAPINEVLSDAELAKSYRSQADALYKEASALRKAAEELDPKPKRTTKTPAAKKTTATRAKKASAARSKVSD